MAYGGKPATDTTDAVRLAIGDTSSSPVLTDDEIDYYYSTYGNVLLAASHAAGDLAGRKSCLHRQLLKALIYFPPAV